MDETNPDAFRQRLEELQEFPCVYPFAFIVPAEQLEAAMALFPEGTAQRRPSRTGKYVSVKADMEVQTAQEVLDIYQRARSIPGIVSL